MWLFKRLFVKQVIFEMEKILKENFHQKLENEEKEIRRVVANISKFKKYFLGNKYNNLNLILKSALAWEKN